MLTIACLFYGDYDVLARRLLTSLAARLPSPVVRKVVLRGNCVSVDTYGLLKRFEADHRDLANLHCSDVNHYKYPVLRSVIHDQQLVDDDDVLMWFDDDSCVRPTAADDWLTTAAAAVDGYDVVGQPWRARLRPGQLRWIQSRPWYAGRPVGDPVQFPTGGWWMARVDVLRRYDWPDPMINHRGGDVMTGALIEQQRLRFRAWADGVAINADAMLNDAKSPRRGHDEPPVGVDP